MPSDNDSFEHFGHHFQDKLAYIIAHDGAFADQIQEVLEYNFFEFKHLQCFTKMLFDYKNKYKIHPGIDTIKDIINIETCDENSIVKEQVVKFFNEKILVGDVLSDKEYIKEKSLDFCKKQKLKEAMLKSIPLLQQSSFDEISTVINNALKLGTDNNFGHEYFRDFETRYVTNNRNCVSTGWPLIDELTQGGLGRGELGVIIAPTSAGKTHSLIYLGASALLAGYNVIHYTLEMTDNAVARRYDSCIAEVSINDLNLFKDSIFQKIKNVPGNLIIKEYPTKSVSIKTIKTHYEKVRQRKNKAYDLVIIDYGDLLKPLKNNTEKRHELESVFEDMRAMAQELHCSMWSASQTKRDTMEKEIITMESISESFAKCFIADLILALSRTMKDKNSNQGHFYIAKNRNGKDGILYPLFVDTSMSKIKVFSPQEKDDHGVVISSTTNNGNPGVTAKEKYKLLRKQLKDV